MNWEAIAQAVSPDLTVYVPPAVLEAELEPELLLELEAEVPVEAEPEAAAGALLDAAGMRRVWPTVIVFGSLMLLAAISAAVVTPLAAAMAPSVSPALTVYVPAADALDDALLLDGAVVAAEAALVPEGGRVEATDAELDGAELDDGVLLVVAPAFEAAALELVGVDVAPATPVPVAVALAVELALAVAEPVGEAIGVNVANVEGNAAEVGKGVGTGRFPPTHATSRRNGALNGMRRNSLDRDIGKLGLECSPDSVYRLPALNASGAWAVARASAFARPFGKRTE